MIKNIGTDNSRVVEFLINSDLTKKFYIATQSITEKEIQYFPYLSPLLAKCLRDLVGTRLQTEASDALKNRKKGSVLVLPSFLELQDIDEAEKRIFSMKIAIAVGWLLGKPNDDPLSGKSYAAFEITSSTEKQSLLYEYRKPFSMHTDGAFLHEPTDWLLMGKLQESNVSRGRSQILHIDDWEGLEELLKYSESEQEYIFKPPPSSDPRRTTWGFHRELDESVTTKIFEDTPEGKTVRFIDQFVHPATVEGGWYIHEIINSLKNNKGTKSLPLNQGEVLIVNNTFYLHGRETIVPTDSNRELKRELLRMRGTFYE